MNIVDRIVIKVVSRLYGEDIGDLLYDVAIAKDHNSAKNILKFLADQK